MLHVHIEAIHINDDVIIRHGTEDAPRHVEDEQIFRLCTVERDRNGVFAPYPL